MEYRRHRVVFLPPYSPMLNLIELGFSAVKAAVKRKLNERLVDILNSQAASDSNLILTAYRHGILKRIVRNVSEDETITPDMCANWQRHVFQYRPGCMVREYILM